MPGLGRPIMAESGAEPETKTHNNNIQEIRLVHVVKIRWRELSCLQLIVKGLRSSVSKFRADVD